MAKDIDIGTFEVPLGKATVTFKYPGSDAAMLIVKLTPSAAFPDGPRDLARHSFYEPEPHLCLDGMWGLDGLSWNWGAADGTASDTSTFYVRMWKRRARKAPTKNNVWAWLQTRLPTLLVAIEKKRKESEARDADAKVARRREALDRAVKEVVSRKVARLQAQAMADAKLMPQILALLAKLTVDTTARMNEQDADLMGAMLRESGVDLQEAMKIAEVTFREFVPTLTVHVIGTGGTIIGSDNVDPRSYRVSDEREGTEPGATVVMTWDELAAVNDPETMEEIATLAVGEKTVLGQCDPIERVS